MTDLDAIRDIYVWIECDLLVVGDSIITDRHHASSGNNELLKPIAADCTVIAAEHPESPADEVIADAGFCLAPTVDGLAERLNAALGSARLPTEPAEHAQEYDWDAIAERAETAYQRAHGDT